MNDLQIVWIEIAKGRAWIAENEIFTDSMDRDRQTSGMDHG